MKNFDLDQIKNRQLQEMPDHFYEEMQQKVLEKTVFQKDDFAIGKKSNFNWYYAAAASLAMIFGGTYFFNNEDVVDNPVLTSAPTVEQVIVSDHNLAQNSELIATQEEVVEPTATVNFVDQNTKEKIVKVAAKEPKIAKTKVQKPVKVSKPEDQIDFLLENFTAEDMATLAQNSDKDVYLDLFNKY